MHGPLQQNVVCIDRLRDGFEAVGISGNANKVGGNEANDGKHSCAAVTEFGLSEEGYEGRVGFGEVEWIEFEVAAFEVFSADAIAMGDSISVDIFKKAIFDLLCVYEVEREKK